MQVDPATGGVDDRAVPVADQRPPTVPEQHRCAVGPGDRQSPVRPEETVVAGGETEDLRRLVGLHRQAQAAGGTVQL